MNSRLFSKEKEVEPSLLSLPVMPDEPACWNPITMQAEWRLERIINTDVIIQMMYTDTDHQV